MQDTVCTLSDIIIREEVNDDSSTLCKTFCIDLTGNRFLYKQVRFLVGTIVQYASSKHVNTDDIARILEGGKWYENSDDGNGDQKEVPFPRFCAPPQGLSLEKVKFGEEWCFDWLHKN